MLPVTPMIMIPAHIVEHLQAMQIVENQVVIASAVEVGNQVIH